jgi:hypothetical protein
MLHFRARKHVRLMRQAEFYHNCTGSRKAKFWRLIWKMGKLFTDSLCCPLPIKHLQQLSKYDHYYYCLLLLLRWGETCLCGTGLLAGPLSNSQMIHEWIWSNGGMILTGENRSTRRKTYPTATLLTTRPTWADLGAYSGIRGEKRLTS